MASPLPFTRRKKHRRLGPLSDRKQSRLGHRPLQRLIHCGWPIVKTVSRSWAKLGTVARSWCREIGWEVCLTVTPAIAPAHLIITHRRRSDQQIPAVGNAMLLWFSHKKTLGRNSLAYMKSILHSSQAPKARSRFSKHRKAHRLQPQWEKNARCRVARPCVWTPRVELATVPGCWRHEGARPLQMELASGGFRRRHLVTESVAQNMI